MCTYREEEKRDGGGNRSITRAKVRKGRGGGDCEGWEDGLSSRGAACRKKVVWGSWVVKSRNAKSAEWERR